MSNRLVKNTIYYSIGEIIPRVISFILLPILTVYLTASEYGINMYTSSVMMFVFVLASLSLNTFLLKNYYAQKDENSRKELIGGVFLFIVFFNVFIVVLQVLFFPFIIDYFKINVPFKPYFLLAIINNFFDVISLIPLVLFRVKEDAKGFLIMSLSRTVLQFVVIYILVVIFKQGLEGSYYGRLYVNIPFAFIYFYCIKRNGILKININLIKKALHFSLPLLPGSLAYLFISLSDRVILERYISLDEIGIYSVAVTLALVLNVIDQALYKAFEPILFKESHNESFNNTNLKLYKIYLFALFIGAFATSIFSKEFFYLATSGVFREAYKIVPFLIISVVISGINTYLNILMIIRNKQKLVSLVLILSAIVSVALNLVFIPFFGFYGAIMASVTTFLITNIIFQFNVIIDKKYLFTQLVLMFLVVASPLTYDKYVSISFSLNLIVKFFILLIFVLLAFKILGIDNGIIKDSLFKRKLNSIQNV